MIHHTHDTPHTHTHSLSLYPQSTTHTHVTFSLFSESGWLLNSLQNRFVMRKWLVIGVCDAHTHCTPHTHTQRTAPAYTPTHVYPQHTATRTRTRTRSNSNPSHTHTHTHTHTNGNTMTAIPHARLSECARTHSSIQCRSSC